MDSLYQWLICSGLRELKVPTSMATGPVSVPCDKKLLKYEIKDGNIEIKCSRCGTVNEYHRTLGENNEAI